jgi:organic radical activating enzyme
MDSMSKPILPFVEIMVTQSCNLSCHGCTNYSDIAHKGYLTWEQGRREIEPWLERVIIPDFGILGGEPLMNPDIRNWIRGLREILPNSQIRFTTNGILLAQNFDIVDLLHEIENVVFKIAVHEHNTELEGTIQQVLDKFEWQEVVEFGVKRFKTTNNFRYHIRRPDVFYKTFVGPYQDMRPHDSNPADAFDICCQQTCPLLYNGKLYKCSTNGLLADTLSKFNNPNYTDWEPYLIDGLLPTCNNEQLEQFLNNFGKPHAVCRSCPTLKDTASSIIHLENVSRKKLIPLNT